MTIKISKKTLISIIVFALVTALVIGMSIFISDIIRKNEEAKWKKGIYILPTSQYHAFGLYDDITTTQLNFVCVKENERAFRIFLSENHFILSNDSGDELDLVYQEMSFSSLNIMSMHLIKDGGIYQHYVITFSLKFDTREYREFDKISIYQKETLKESIEIGRIIFEFFDYEPRTGEIIYKPATVTDDVFKLPVNYSIVDVDNFVIDSVMVKLTEATFDSDEIDSSELFNFPVNAECNPTTCTYEFNPFFTTTNDFITYTLKPLTKYTVDGITHTDTYKSPLLYHRTLTNEAYFEVSDTFTSLFESPTE